MRPNNDHYPTPPEFVRALFSVEVFNGSIWEPCCGSGEIASEIRNNSLFGTSVFASTIETDYREYSSKGAVSSLVSKNTIYGGIDFLSCDIDSVSCFHHKIAKNIITNPPYNIANDIVKHALSLDVHGKIAMLLNVKWPTSLKRKDEIFDMDPPTRVWVCSDRMAMYPKGHEGKKGAPTENYAWFVWDRGVTMKQPTTIGWLCLKEFKDEI